MNWYEKLNQYFPVEEMKSKEHMETLLQEKGDVYHKDEGKYHVLMYAEFDTFIFIDYVYVSKEARGQGIGHKLMKKLKEKGKPIILEVEPVDYDDTDTEKDSASISGKVLNTLNRLGTNADHSLQMK